MTTDHSFWGNENWIAQKTAHCNTGADNGTLRYQVTSLLCSHSHHYLLPCDLAKRRACGSGSFRSCKNPTFQDVMCLQLQAQGVPETLQSSPQYEIQRICYSCQSFLCSDASCSGLLLHLVNQSLYTENMNDE